MANKRGTPVRRDPAIVQQAIQLQKEGKGINEIASIMGRSPRSVRDIFYDQGIMVKGMASEIVKQKALITQEEKEKIARMKAVSLVEKEKQRKKERLQKNKLNKLITKEKKDIIPATAIENAPIDDNPEGYFRPTTATRKIAAMTKRIRAIQGGTSASKSISTLLILINQCQSDTKPKLTSIVSESLPHLKKGLIRDFLNIMNKHRYYSEPNWNRTDFIYTFETGSQIEFFSVDQPDKVRGPRRDRLFMNEANNIPYESFDQLEIRTKEFVYLDWNPTNEFWFYTEVLPKRTDVEHIILTYKDNEALDRNIVRAIEQRKGNASWWRVYGEGQLGEVEGKIYKDWAIIDEIPHEAKLVRYGIDFGYTDPTAIVAIYSYDGGFIIDEIAYEKEMSMTTIHGILWNKERALIVADSAQPGSIADIARQGLTIIGAEKGRDSVANGIAILQDQRISVTRTSVNVIKEYRNYMWERDPKTNKMLPIPEHDYSHCFAGNSLVHTTKGKKYIDELIGQEGYLYSRDGTVQRFYNVRETRKNADTIKITFEDNNMLEVTPDHLLLLPSGEWMQAGLLLVGDMIQSVMYEGTNNIQWAQLLQVQGLKILQRVCRWPKVLAASIYLGVSQRANTRQSSRASFGSQSGEQCDRESSANISERPFISSLQQPIGGTKREEKRVGGQDKTFNKGVAWIGTREGVAQATWSENVCEKRSYFSRMCSLPQDIYYKAICKIRKILSSELQNESSQKKIKRIERGFCDVTYNMEVENTHCLLVDGVIAHNSMDAIRYSIVSYVKKGQGATPVINYANSARYGRRGFTIN